MKTTLQRSVQALERHRDIYFADHPENRPASIIITTLAARAYPGKGCCTRCSSTSPKRCRRWSSAATASGGVANPVQPGENFADRWRNKPESTERFFTWTRQAQADFAAIGEERGIDRVPAKVAKSFGEGPARRAGAKYGIELREARDAGRLGIAARTGTLGAAATRSVPRHTFHSDAPDRP